MNIRKKLSAVASWTRPHWGSCVLVALLGLSLLPLLVYRFPPFHDYPPWVFQGYLLRLTHTDPEAVFRHYALVRTPVPYSAWPIVAWALSFLVHSPELVGKAFFVLTTLVFVGGASYLIRSVQGYPTALEFLPLVWVYDRYAYDGLLNYHLSAGLCLLAVGYLHRITSGGQELPSNRSLFLLSGLSVVTYLSHLMGWLPLCLAVAVYSCLICLRQRSLKGTRVVLSLLPAVLLLSWYTFSRVGTVGVVLYSSLVAKLYAWAPVLLLFFRLEPFGIQPPIALVLNLGALVAIVAIIAAFAERQAGITGRIFLHAAPITSALVCLACAALIPFIWFGGLAGPDARFIQPAFWLGLASLRYRSRTRKQVLLVVMLVAFVLVVNVTQFARVQPLLTEVYETLDTVIPADARVLSVSLRSPPLSLRDATRDTGLASFTVGMPLLDYFDLYRFMSQGRHHADLGMFGTGWLSNRQADEPPQLRLAVISNRDLQESAKAILRQAETYDFIELFGYCDDVRGVETLLAPTFSPVAQGQHFSVLSRNWEPL